SGSLALRVGVTVSRQRNFTPSRHSQRVNRSNADHNATVKRCAIEWMTAKWRFIYWQANP
ncbi:hypothetical protein GBF38_019688, partial [Nibea albiflora]